MPLNNTMSGDKIGTLISAKSGPEAQKIEAV
jgi:hypothetical protein